MQDPTTAGVGICDVFEANRVFSSAIKEIEQCASRGSGNGIGGGGAAERGPPAVQGSLRTFEADVG